MDPFVRPFKISSADCNHSWSFISDSQSTTGLEIVFVFRSLDRIMLSFILATALEY